MLFEPNSIYPSRHKQDEGEKVTDQDKTIPYQAFATSVLQALASEMSNFFDSFYEEKPEDEDEMDDL